jgi:hypothetical protein
MSNIFKLTKVLEQYKQYHKGFFKVMTSRRKKMYNTLVKLGLSAF